MRYFERLRRSLRLGNGRCRKYAHYRCENEAYSHISGTFNKFYVCTEHIHLYKHLLNWKVFVLADGETMECDYEV